MRLSKLLVALGIVGAVGCASSPSNVEKTQELTLNEFLQQGEIGRSAVINRHHIVLLHNGQSEGKWCRQYSDNGLIKAVCKQGTIWAEADIK